MADEPPDHVAGLNRKALEYILPKRLVITTDCGFGVRRELGLPEAHIRAAAPKLYFAGAGEG